MGDAAMLNDLWSALRAEGLAELPISLGFDGTVTALADVSAKDLARVRAVVAKRQAPQALLAAAKLQAQGAIDTEAERQRLRWITPGAGQAMTYARKVEEARRLATDPDPQPDAYPMLAASIGIDGVDLAAVATTIVGMDAQWQVIGAAIEARRLGLKRDVAAATDDTALTAIDITAGWPE